MHDKSSREFFLSLPLGQRFLQGLRQGRLGHGWLISGSSMENLQHFAQGMLEYVFCSQFTSMPRSEFPQPCGTCRGCKEFKAGTSFVKYLRPDIKSRSNTILVESVREFQKSFDFKVAPGEWKVGIIIDAECMNEQAQNAFLKTLEEPHGNTLFLLLTSQPQSLLSTIISRCRNVNLNLDSLDSEPLNLGQKELLQLLIPSSGTANAVIAASRFSKLFKDLEKEAEKEARSQLEKLYLGREEKPKKNEVDNLAAGLSMKKKLLFLARIEVWFAACLETALQCSSSAVSQISSWQLETPSLAPQLEARIFSSVDALATFQQELKTNLALDAATLDFTTKVCRK